MDDGREADEMPVDGGGSAVPLMSWGWLPGRKGAARGGPVRDPNRASAKVERTPVPVLSATLPTEDAIWSFLREGEKGVIGSRCRHYWQECFWR